MRIVDSQKTKLSIAMEVVLNCLDWSSDKLLEMYNVQDDETVEYDKEGGKTNDFEKQVFQSRVSVLDCHVKEEQYHFNVDVSIYDGYETNCEGPAVSAGFIYVQKKGIEKIIFTLRHGNEKKGK